MISEYHKYIFSFQEISNNVFNSFNQTLFMQVFIIYSSCLIQRFSVQNKIGHYLHYSWWWWWWWWFTNIFYNILLGYFFFFSYDGESKSKNFFCDIFLFYHSMFVSVSMNICTISIFENIFLFCCFLGFFFFNFPAFHSCLNWWLYPV